MTCQHWLGIGSPRPANLLLKPLNIPLRRQAHDARTGRLGFSDCPDNDADWKSDVLESALISNVSNSRIGVSVPLPIIFLVNCAGGATVLALRVMHVVRRRALAVRLGLRQRGRIAPCMLPILDLSRPFGVRRAPPGRRARMRPEGRRAHTRSFMYLFPFPF